MTKDTLAALPVLPLFIDLRGAKVVAGGDSDGLPWKIELLTAAGADLQLFVDGQVPSAADFLGAKFAIGGYLDPIINQSFADLARAGGAIVNLIDNPSASDVQFGAIVNRAPIVIGISTDGAAPALGRAIRGRIEGLLHNGLANWGAIAKTWRPRLDGFSFAARRKFWDGFAKLALARPWRAPDDDDFSDLAGVLDRPLGEVILIYAITSDPDLLTIGAVRALQSADVILYDDQIGASILDFARREAKKISINHVPDVPTELISLATSGKVVICLTSGSRLEARAHGDACAACQKADIPIRVIGETI
jgi:uroporphyrin-III C-methyltransferase / precorrin-2 dehydrogenase / sirohydrochlorin ferrochelatase